MPINSFLYPGPTNSNPFTINNSCKWGGTDNEYMSKTLGTPSNTDKYTFSFWTKRTLLANDGHFCTVYTDGNNYSTINFDGSDRLTVLQYISASIQLNLVTTKMFRDPSAWSHFVIQFDSTQSTASNRCKIFHNGSRITAFDTETYWDQNTDGKLNEASATLTLNAITTGSQYHGYVAEFIMCDGQAYEASDFGEFDEDSPTIWKPKNVSGLTFGTNGFYLDFKDSSNLGNDANGGTDFSETNFAATDQATDTPTNNFCTLNPLVPTTNITFSEGNCKMATHASNDTQGGGIGTFGLTAGKWYWEVKMASLLANHTHGVISELTAELYQNATILQNDTGVTQFRNDDGGEMVKDGTQTTADYGTLDDGDILGIAFNADDNQISIYDNGSAIVSNYTISTTRGVIFPYFGSGINTTFEINFGGCSAFTISSAQSDENGYGNFEHAPPSGYLALCSKNLGSDGG